MKTLKVTLNGVERELRYTRAERESIESRFDCGLHEFMIEQVSVRQDADGNVIGMGRIASQVALVYYGLKHHGSKVTEKNVAAWMEKAAEQNEFYSVIGNAVSAVYASGVLGFVPAEPEEEAEEGKDEGSESAETSSEA